jgi:hypothetical protein
MRPVVLLLIASALLAAPASAETFDRTVKANARTAIGGFFGYEVDTCYPSNVPDARVRHAPANGQIDIVPHEQVLGTNNRCSGRKVRGLAYIYTPKKGFKGIDELAIDVPWSSTDTGVETLWTYTYRIRVE